MNTIEPVGRITGFLEKYYEARQKGLDEWEEFWDYRHRVEGAGAGMLSNEHLSGTCVRLLLYLIMYGMARRTRLVESGCSRKFASVLQALPIDSLLQLFDNTFETTVWTEDPFTGIWESLGSALRSARISDSPTMRSKILMALWGQMPAFDQYFEDSFMATFHFRRRSPFPSRTLDSLRERYNRDWRAEIEEAPDAWKHTTGGIRIPDVRLLDIAFWYNGGGRFFTEEAE